jgi:hypothetical protein
MLQFITQIRNKKLSLIIFDTVKDESIGVIKENSGFTGGYIVHLNDSKEIKHFYSVEACINFIETRAIIYEAN